MILVSACLMGQNIKYNGGNNRCERLLDLQDKLQLLPVCPEALGGLSIPRPPAEIRKGTGETVLEGRADVVQQTGDIVTTEYVRGAEAVLALAEKHHVKIAIMKENSPSCGANFIYDGNFSGEKLMGQGVTAALLEQNGIKVYSEKDLNDELIEKLMQE